VHEIRLHLGWSSSSGTINPNPKSKTVTPTTAFLRLSPSRCGTPKTLQVIKTIDVDGRPYGIMFDLFNERVWVLSHMPPYATLIDAKEGTVVGTLDLGGQPEQAASDGKGTVYVNILDKSNIRPTRRHQCQVAWPSVPRCRARLHF
jgi:hypothetical protein